MDAMLMIRPYPAGIMAFLATARATDYVSGMTDGYAKRLYRELRGMDTSLNV